nr:MAG TPA: Endolysin [Caudoviricetes sp.]
MSKKQEMIQFFIDKANSGDGVDNDGAYRFQCADVPCFGIRNWYGISLWGNAIDLLESAENQGLQVVYGAQYPKAGWFFVKNFVAGDGVNYGHTGLVYEDSDGDTIKTIEQNIDGNWDYLEVGGPCRYNERSVDSIVGYIVPPDDEEEDEASVISSEFEEEDGTFTIGDDPINVRRSPDTYGEVVAVYEAGETVHYDSKGSANGYRWISFIGASGNRNYMAIGQTDEASNRITLWGTVE